MVSGIVGAPPVNPGSGVGDTRFSDPVILPSQMQENRSVQLGLRQLLPVPKIFPPVHVKPAGQSASELQDLLHELRAYVVGVGVAVSATDGLGVPVVPVVTLVGVGVRVGVGVGDLVGDTVGVGVLVGVDVGVLVGVGVAHALMLDVHFPPTAGQQ
jgi:hypothetical protein